MARKRNYRTWAKSAYGNYRTRRAQTAYGNRTSYYSRARSGARKANSTIGIYNPGIAYMAGLGIGALTNLDDKLDARIKIGLACLPLKGGIGGQLKKAAEGLCLGDMIQHSLNLPSLMGSANTSNQLKGFGKA